MQDRFKLKWHDAMAAAGRHFTRAQQDEGWPQSMKPDQLAALQRPYVMGGLEHRPGRRRTEAMRNAISDACIDGSLPHSLTVIHTPEKTIVRRIGFVRSWEGSQRGFKTQTTPANDVTVHTVTAPAFAAWLAAQGLTPSPHIQAWFEAMGVNTHTEAMPNAMPAKGTTQTTKHRDQLAPLVEAAQKDCDPNDAAAVFTILKTWAEEQKPRAPLVGLTEDGRIQWRDSNDTPKELDKRALAKRLKRQRSQPATKPPGKQLRRIK